VKKKKKGFLSSYVKTIKKNVKIFSKIVLKHALVFFGYHGVMVVFYLSNSIALSAFLIATITFSIFLIAKISSDWGVFKKIHNNYLQLKNNIESGYNGQLHIYSREIEFVDIGRGIKKFINGSGELYMVFASDLFEDLKVYEEEVRKKTEEELYKLKEDYYNNLLPAEREKHDMMEKRDSVIEKRDKVGSYDSIFSKLESELRGVISTTQDICSGYKGLKLTNSEKQLVDSLNDLINIATDREEVLAKKKEEIMDACNIIIEYIDRKINVHTTLLERERLFSRGVQHMVNMGLKMQEIDEQLKDIIGVNLKNVLEIFTNFDNALLSSNKVLQEVKIDLLGEQMKNKAEGVFDSLDANLAAYDEIVTPFINNLDFKIKSSEEYLESLLGKGLNS
jgi:hypothetical protein